MSWTSASRSSVPGISEGCSEVSRMIRFGVGVDENMFAAAGYVPNWWD